MAARRVFTVIWFVVIGVFVLGVASACCLFGGYKGIKLGIYLFRYPNKQSTEYVDVVKEFAGTKTEKEISGFYAGYVVECVWLWTLNRLQPLLVSGGSSHLMKFRSIQYLYSDPVEREMSSRKVFRFEKFTLVPVLCCAYPSVLSVTSTQN